jgi:hypothetical protein
LEAARGRIARQRETTTLHDILVRAEEAAQNDVTEPLACLAGAASGANVNWLDGGAREAASGGVALLLPKSHPLVVKRGSDATELAGGESAIGVSSERSDAAIATYASSDGALQGSTLLLATIAGVKVNKKLTLRPAF